MPLFMDVHTVSGATAEAVAGAHQKDLQVQPQYGVKYVKYWLDEGTGKIFCLAEAPSKEAFEARSIVHVAHGVNLNERANAAHRHEEHNRGAIEQHAPLKLEKADIKPRVADLDRKLKRTV